MKVSFIVPIYNAQLYLEECVRSIMRQSHRDIQIILVDDGSTDCSLQKCHRLQKEDSRIEIISQKNLGVSAARNAGMAHASGEWIAFVDADDFVSEDYIETFKDYLNEDYDICCGGEGKPTGEKNDTKLLDRKQLYLYERGLLNKYAVVNAPHLTSACGKLYRRSFIREKGIAFPENLKKSEDALFNQYVFHYAIRGAYNEKQIYYYRKHENSASNRYDAGSTDNYKKHLELLKQFLSEEKIYKDMEADYHIRAVFHFFYCTATDFCHRDNPYSYKVRKEKFMQARSEIPFSRGFEEAKVAKLSLKEKILFYCIKKKIFILVDGIFKIQRLIGAER